MLQKDPISRPWLPVWAGLLHLGTATNHTRP